MVVIGFFYGEVGGHRSVGGCACDCPDGLWLPRRCGAVGGFACGCHSVTVGVTL